MKTTSNAGRKYASTEMLEKKRARLQELLEDAADGGRLEEGSFPKSMAELRSWVDEPRGLLKIGSPRITSRRLKPEHSDILNEIDELIRRLLAYKSIQRIERKKRPSLQLQLDKVTTERDDARYLVSRLLSQVQMMLHEIHTLQLTSRAADEARARTSATVKSLTSQVVQLGGSTVTRIK